MCLTAGLPTLVDPHTMSVDTAVDYYTCMYDIAFCTLRTQGRDEDDNLLRAVTAQELPWLQSKRNLQDKSKEFAKVRATCSGAREGGRGSSVSIWYAAVRLP